MNKNIAIIGMFGQMTNEVANQLADKLELMSGDVNEVFKYYNGTPYEVYKKHGVEYLDKVLTRAIDRCVSCENVVVSLLANSLENDKNRDIIKENCEIIWLSNNNKECWKNSKGLNKPYLMKGTYKEHIALYEKYSVNYRLWSDIEVDVENSTTEQVVNEIIDKLVEKYTK